ncbi:MAG: hypothetical protein IMW92_08825 [Bacillales bacterium]|nr:hypothetical protein [Bacillales bacterium]
MKGSIHFYTGRNIKKKEDYRPIKAITPLILGVLLFIVGVSSDSDSSTSKKEESKPQVTESKEASTTPSFSAVDKDFPTFANAYYKLSPDQQTSVYDQSLYNHTVTWTGKIVDFLSDSVIVFGGGKSGYNGEDWETLSTTKKELLPYVFIAQLKDKSQLHDLKPGQQIKIKGDIGSRGNVKMNYNWKLYNSEIVN